MLSNDVIEKIAEVIQGKTQTYPVNNIEEARSSLAKASRVGTRDDIVAVKNSVKNKYPQLLK